MKRRAVTAVAVTVFAAAFVTGCGGGSGDSSTLEDQLSAADAARAASQQKVVEVETKLDEAEGKLAEYSPAHIRQIRHESDAIVAKAKAEGKELLHGIENEAKAKEQKLAQIEESIFGAKEEKAKSTISDGTWTLEKDYIAGVYEAPGGGSCYWALLQGIGGELGDIVENGGFNKHQVLEISSPYFETRDCGTWKRVG